MPAMKIVKYPHPALRVEGPAGDRHRQGRPVAPPAQMLELMYKHEGLGLAAPQVGLDRPAARHELRRRPGEEGPGVRRDQPGDRRDARAAVNDREGCLSFPGLYQNVRRAKTVKVQTTTSRASSYEMTCHDLPARVWQHEIDHLNGVLFIDKMGSLGLHRQPEGPREVHRRLREGQEEGRPAAGPGTEAVTASGSRDERGPRRSQLDRV